MLIDRSLMTVFPLEFVWFYGMCIDKLVIRVLSLESFCGKKNADC